MSADLGHQVSPHCVVADSAADWPVADSADLLLAVVVAVVGAFESAAG